MDASHAAMAALVHDEARRGLAQGRKAVIATAATGGPIGPDATCHGAVGGPGNEHGRKTRMQRLRVVDWPRLVPREAYDQAVAAMALRLSNADAVRGAWKVGSIADPGISDLDLVVVFKEGRKCAEDFRAGLSGSDRYLFSHGLFGLSLEHWKRTLPFPVFHNYEPLLGHDLPGGRHRDRTDDCVNVQTALEYALRLLVSLWIQLSFGVLRARGFLLHLKALRHDLNLLGTTTGPLVALTERILGWRRQWFAERPTAADLVAAARQSRDELERQLRASLAITPLYLPGGIMFAVARGIKIARGEHFELRRRGWRLPPTLTSRSRRFFNLQLRFNSFEVRVPMERVSVPESVRERAELQLEMCEYNRKNLPTFMPPMCPMTLKRAQ